jgi:hypothetical protein
MHHSLSQNRIYRGARPRTHYPAFVASLHLGSGEITVKDWNSFTSLDWAADGKGFFISSNPTDACPLCCTWTWWAMPTRSGKRRTSWPPGPFLLTKENTSQFPHPRSAAMSGWWTTSKPARFPSRTPALNLILAAAETLRSDESRGNHRPTERIILSRLTRTLCLNPANGSG